MQVLNTYTETVPTGWFWVILIVSAVAGALVVLLKDDITRFFEMHFNGFIYSSASKIWKVAVIAILLIGGFGLSQAQESHIYAEATIIENYPVGALYSKYEIKEKRGDLWVLELRDSYEESDVVSEEVAK